MDPLQWMGAVRMRVQTADKNITIQIHMTYSPSVNVLWNEKLAVCKKQSIFNRLFNSLTGFNVFFSEKVHPLLSSHIKIHQHICLEMFWTALAVHIYLLI